jgi:hypothetical protein
VNYAEIRAEIAKRLGAGWSELGPDTGGGAAFRHDATGVHVLVYPNLLSVSYGKRGLDLYERAMSIRTAHYPAQAVEVTLEVAQALVDQRVARYGENSALTDEQWKAWYRQQDMAAVVDVSAGLHVWTFHCYEHSEMSCIAGVFPELPPRCFAGDPMIWDFAASRLADT